MTYTYNPISKRLRQEDHGFKDNLVFIARSFHLKKICKLCFILPSLYILKTAIVFALDTTNL